MIKWDNKENGIKRMKIKKLQVQMNNTEKMQLGLSKSDVN